MSYRLFIFDFDGTLADSAAWFRKELPRLAKRHGFRSPSPEEIEALRGMSSRDIVRALRIPAWKLPAIARDLRARAERAVQYISPHPGVADMLTRVDRAGVRIAVVSSNTAHNIREILGPGPSACVAHYACGAPLFGKAARFRQVLKATGVAASEALSIGDEARDIAAARAAGIATAAVTWGYATFDALTAANPLHIFETPGDIASLAAPRPLKRRRG